MTRGVRELQIRETALRALAAANLPLGHFAAEHWFAPCAAKKQPLTWTRAEADHPKRHGVPFKRVQTPSGVDE